MNQPVDPSFDPPTAPTAPDADPSSQALPTEQMPSVGGPPPIPPPPPGGGGPGDDDHGSDNARWWWIAAIVAIVIAVIIILALALAGGDDDDDTATTTSSSSTSSTSVASTTTTEPTTTTEAPSTTAAITPPTIASFTGPDSVTCTDDTTVQLSWSTENASRTTIAIDGASQPGSFGASATEDLPFACDGGSHAYLLTAFGAGDRSVTETKVVTVDGP